MWHVLAAAAAGAIAGGQKDKKGGYTESNSTNRVNLRDINEMNVGRSQAEAMADSGSMDAFAQLQSLLGGGPGQAEVDANTEFQNSFAAQLQQLLTRGSNPNQQDIAQSQQFTNDIFAPQQTQLNQQFDDQRVQSDRLAARLGRPGTDPVLRNKLFQEQTRQQQSLNSQKTAFSADYAMNLPTQQANYAMSVGGALSNLRQGLATQAFQNRQSLLTMGQQMLQGERNYRLQGADRQGYGYTSNEDWSGGGFKGAMSGAMAGAGAMMGGGGGGGGGGMGGFGG